jgi:hypothetical protein
MALKREVSLGVGLATMALVWGIYNSALPSVLDVRSGQPDDKDAAGTERAASWTAAAAVAGVSLIAKDPTVFVLGGSMVVILAWWHRHANQYNPSLGSAVMPSSRAVMAASMNSDAGYTPGG